MFKAVVPFYRHPLHHWFREDQNVALGWVTQQPVPHCHYDQYRFKWAAATGPPCLDRCVDVTATASLISNWLGFQIYSRDAQQVYRDLAGEAHLIYRRGLYTNTRGGDMSVFSRPLPNKRCIRKFKCVVLPMMAGYWWMSLAVLFPTDKTFLVSLLNTCLCYLYKLMTSRDINR